MKRTTQALVLAALLYGTHAAASGTFPVGTGEWESIPAMETYADRHAYEIANSPSTNPFPVGTGEWESLPAKETFADRHKDQIAQQPFLNPFPVGTGEWESLPAKETYADRYAFERNLQARGESDPALSQ